MGYEGGSWVWRKGLGEGEIVLGWSQQGSHGWRL